jgi:hypothetical protein
VLTGSSRRICHELTARALSAEDCIMSGKDVRKLLMYEKQQAVPWGYVEVGEDVSENVADIKVGETLMYHTAFSFLICSLYHQC